MWLAPQNQKKNRINGSSIANYRKIKLKMLKRTFEKKKKNVLLDETQASSAASRHCCISLSFSTWLCMCSGSSWRKNTNCLASELIFNSIFTLVKIIRWRQLPAWPTAVWQKKCCSLSSDTWPSPDSGWCDLWQGAARDAPPCQRSENNSATEQRSQGHTVCYGTRQSEKIYI